MYDFSWSELKSERLQLVRGVSFSEVLTGRFIDLIDHPSRAGQLIVLYEYRNYVWAMPCIKLEDGLFLKTLYPSRKYTRFYGGKKL